MKLFQDYNLKTVFLKKEEELRKDYESSKTFKKNIGN